MNLLGAIEKLGLAIAKQAAITGGPVIAKLVVCLADLLTITVDIWAESNLSATEKSELYADSYRGLQQAVALAEEEGADIASEVPLILVEQSPAAIGALI